MQFTCCYDQHTQSEEEQAKKYECFAQFTHAFSLLNPERPQTPHERTPGKNPCQAKRQGSGAQGWEI